MKQEENKLNFCSAYEIIMIVHELHQLGYEQLRLKTGMSPSGLCWRWHIYPKVFLGNNNDLECKADYVGFRALEGSTDKRNPEGHDIIKTDYVLRHHSDLIRMAKGEDKEYIRWFQRIVDHAKKGDFPISYSEYYSAKEWIFLKSKEDLPYPPFTPANIDDVPDELMVEYAHHFFDNDSLIELDAVTDDRCLTPSRKEIANVIRQAVKENKGLVSHYESAYEQIGEPSYSGAKELIPIKNGVHVILKTGESFDVYDKMELYAWDKREYKTNINELKMNKNNEKIARICWNENQWICPSGKDGKSKSDQAYENQKGYGHEEWLLDTSKIYRKDGYHYGFIQGMNVKSGIHVNKEYKIHLFAISPSKQKIYVGYIDHAWGVSQKDSAEVYNYYKRKGWLNSMKEEVEYAKCEYDEPKPEFMFNVKFKIKDAHINYSNMPIIKKGINGHRYNLMNKKEELIFEKDDEGEDLIFNTKSYERTTNDNKIIIEPKHKEIQEAVCKLLKEEYKDIKAETSFGPTYGQRVDISGVHKLSGELHFFEVKTRSAKQNIREALGQILEYAHYPSANRAKKLFIIGEKEADEKDKKYLEQLRKLYHIPIWYRWYSFDENTLSGEY